MTLLLASLLLISAAEAALEGDDVTLFVDPRIGNVAPLLVPTFPTFSLPNQMLRMVPAKADYLEDQVSGFPLQVAAHRNPGLLPMRVSLGPITPEAWKRKMPIDHDLEVVRPWHYSTYLIDDGITVSFSPARKAAIYKIDFPRGDASNLLFSGTDSAEMTAIGPNAFAVLEKINYKTRGTRSVTRTMSVYFYGEINDPQGKPFPGIRIEAGKQTLSVTRPATAPPSLLLKYALSYVSAEQAKKNFAAEVASARFEDLLARGKAEWARVLGRIAVEGGSEAQKRSFYTALYRTHERMVDINEGGRYYSGYDGKVHESARPFYVDDWIWDTYLAQHPLRTILDPGMQSDILNSYTLMYEHSGWMPTFPQVHGNHMCMNSYHSAAIFLDGHRKGISGFDLQSAYAGIRKNLTEGTLLPWRQGLQKVALDEVFHEKGYYPALRSGQVESEPEVDGFEKRQAVAVTLGVSYDAWVLAQLARDLGKQEDHERFSLVGQNYRKLWHPEQRLFMPKDDQGEWIMIDPKRDGGPGYRDYYDENNGWTYAWQVQHDLEGLVGLLGGRQATEERLDQLFREPLGMPKNRFYVDGANSTGLVGQFPMGNEPAFHIPYLYNYVGAPWKTQKRVRFLLDVWFKDNIFGIPGDEDGGGMSAFVVFSSMGLYPVTPGQPHYTITSPVFEKTTISLPNGRKFAIIAKGASAQRKYIQKAYLNGRELDAPFITHREVVSGGKGADVQTLHIDRLAAEGMRFTRMRANATVCSPTRAALMSGRYPDRVGVPGLIRTDPANTWGYFDPKVKTLANHLRSAGYHTAIVGKWNLGLTAPGTPNDRGFDFFHGFLDDMMDSYTTHLRQGHNYMRRDREVVTPGGHATDIFTTWASDYLRERAATKSPFFLYLAFNAPHFPMQPPAEWLERVKKRVPGMDEQRALSVGLIEHFDDAVGRVLATLKEAGLDQNTLVVLTSDNGGSLPHAQNNDPWRGGKQSHYDGGLRIPFAVRWPGKVAPGSTSDYAGLTFDIFATALDVAGLARPAAIDAVSLLPALRGAPIPGEPRELYFVRREGGPAYGGKSYEAIIKGDWKLMQNSPYDPLELYNLTDDPQEKNNLFAMNQKVARELQDALRLHVQRGGATPWEPPATDPRDTR